MVTATRPPHPDSASPAGADHWWTAQVHAMLREIAGRHLRGENRVTLNPTDLVHEAYLRMAGLEMGFVDRSHFVRFASTLMRRVLVDHARRKAAGKRGQHPQRLTLRPDHADAAGAVAANRSAVIDCRLEFAGAAWPRSIARCVMTANSARRWR
jgi:DNA-directed RNA polymerase specialized sigma24 family protein